MKKKYIYGLNNFSGVHVQGLKNSVYDIKDYLTNKEIIEEKFFDSQNENLKNLEIIADINSRVYETTNSLIKEGLLPVLFGGDHSIAIGSISASSKNYDNLGVLWIDAHADINNETTSPSGNIHGMPISFLLGNGVVSLSKIGGFSPKLKPENIVYLGLRSVDPGEVQAIKDMNIKAYYYDEIKERTLQTCLEEVFEYLRNIENWHVQFDFDSMDPYLIPAVSTPVDGGFTEDEIIYLFDNILSTDKIKAIDLVEYNKSNDINGRTLKFAKKLLDKISDK